MQVYRRAVKYLNYLIMDLSPSTDSRAERFTSASQIASALDMNDVTVRKDLAFICGSGRPRLGYSVATLIESIQRFLGHDTVLCGAIAGVGYLGSALIRHTKLLECGLKIAVAFDVSPSVVGSNIGGVEVFDTADMVALCKQHDIRIGIISAPIEAAQDICDGFVNAGIRVIWNFAPVNLKVASDVNILNEDMTAHLAFLVSKANAFAPNDAKACVPNAKFINA